AMKVQILRRFARGYGTCSGAYRLMERETGKLCDPCKAKADARGEVARLRQEEAEAAAAAATAGNQGQPGALAESGASQ
ncbi:hypothetical protein B0H65DRAFT_437026, partial [Neurospora tetraspora]